MHTTLWHHHDLRTGSGLHRLVVGRTREVRGPDAMEMAAVGIIVSIVAVMAMWFGLQLMHITESLEAVSVASGPEMNAILYHSAHGHWPAAGDSRIAAGERGRYLSTMRVGHRGVLTAELTWKSLPYGTPPRIVPFSAKDAHLLSFRPQLLGARGTAAVSFICGYARPIAGARVTSGTNRTNMSKTYLPPFCR